MVRYTLLRILIFLGCFILARLVWRDDAGLLLAGVVAALASMAISYVVLRPMRQRYSEEISHQLEERSARKHGVVTDEDAEDAEDTAGTEATADTEATEATEDTADAAGEHPADSR